MNFFHYNIELIKVVSELTESNYIKDFENQNRIIIGGDDDECRIIEKIYKPLFPKAKILRYDRDTTSKKNHHYTILNKFENQEADYVLIDPLMDQGEIDHFLKDIHLSLNTSGKAVVVVPTNLLNASFKISRESILPINM